MVTNKDERSLGELFSELSRETAALVRQEVALAKSELSEKVSRLGRSAGLVGVGGVLGHAGLLTLIAAIVIILANAGLPLWASALVVAVVLLIVSYVLTQQGLTGLKREPLKPAETIDTLKENAQWAKGQLK
jgi:uncharacterized membrane protein YqjE